MKKMERGGSLTPNRRRHSFNSLKHSASTSTSPRSSPVKSVTMSPTVTIVTPAPETDSDPDLDLDRPPSERHEHGGKNVSTFKLTQFRDSAAPRSRGSYLTSAPSVKRSVSFSGPALSKDTSSSTLLVLTPCSTDSSTLKLASPASCQLEREASFSLSTTLPTTAAAVQLTPAEISSSVSPTTTTAVATTATATLQQLFPSTSNHPSPPSSSSSVLRSSSTSPILAPSAAPTLTQTLQLISAANALRNLASSTGNLQLVAEATMGGGASSGSSAATLQIIPTSAESSTSVTSGTTTATVQLVPFVSATSRPQTSAVALRGISPSSSSSLQYRGMEVAPYVYPTSRNVYNSMQYPSQSQFSSRWSSSSWSSSDVDKHRGETCSQQSSKGKSKKKCGSCSPQGGQSPARACSSSSRSCPASCTCGSPSASSTERLITEIHMSKKEILKKYRLHISVGFIFIFTLLFVSLGWYYRDKTQREDAINQKIFIDPRKRVLTLSDGNDEISVLVGQDLPPWQLPLHCPVHTDGNPNSKECIWKNNAVLRVQYFVATAPDQSTKGSAECYRVSWETLQLPRVPHDCFHVGNALWYGPSNQSAETFPVRGQFDYVPTPYQLSNSGVFSSVTDLYWLSSSGVGLLLNANDPLSVHWNTTVADHMCVVSNYSGALYGKATHNALPHMNYTICNGPDPLTTHLIMKSMVRGTREPVAPSNDMFNAPQWSVSDITRKTDYNEQDVMDIVAKLKKHGLNCSLLVMDGDWQQNHGDLTFDSTRFTNLTNMTDTVHGTCNLELQVSPYFDYRSMDNFHNGVDKQLFVKDAGGEVPGLIRWQNGPAAAMLDVSSSRSRAWFKSLITPLFNQLAEGAARAVRLSYGSKGWLPYRPTFSDATDSMSVHKLRREMAELMSGFTSKLVLEHTSGSQALPGIVAVRTDIDMREGRSCLVNVVEKALTLGLLGYPYVLADGFSVPKGRQSSFLSSPPSRDLFTRWMQMAAFFPAYKFSVAPWIYDAPSTSSSSPGAGGKHLSSLLTTVNIARNLSRLHSELILKAISSPALQEDVVGKGLPILRPVWWVDAANGEVHHHRLDDEFLVGDSLLVAPVLCEGVTKRSIYVPRGVWSDKLRNNIVLGPTMLRDYRVELHEVPYFQRMRTHNEAKQ